MEGGAERRIVTVLFADLVGFTSLSESLDPEDVSLVQRAYFDGVRETIGRYGGVLEKFIGDAVMAVFGAPRARDDDAERAVRAGLALTAAVEQLAGRLELDGALALRVGVNSGEVLQAERGREDEALVTGDAVNVAARLQALAAPGHVFVGEATALAVAEAVELEDRGRVELKGKREPVRVWRVAGVRAERSRDEAMGRLRAPLVGRDAELAELAALVERSAHGPVRATVVAPPGVGKTRLLAELALRVAAPAWTARVRPDVLAPYDAVRQLLHAALGGAPDAALEARLLDRGASAARAAAVASDAAVALRPGSVEGGADVGLDREALFSSWIEALDALADGRPAVWVLEDVHWAGADLLAFLDLAGRAEGARLVLATARPSVLESAPEWTAAGRVVELPALAPAPSADLVRALTGGALGDRLAERIAAVSDGNPLFVEELLRSWVSSGTLVASDGAWRLARPVEEVALPATVQAIYGGQLDDLPAPARSVARRASVAGRAFPARALAALGAAEPEEGVRTLVRRALVAGPADDGLLGANFAFRHALLRDAGYASLSRADRAALHARYAEWLADAAGARSGEVAELVGRHLEQAAAAAPALARELLPGLDRAEARRRAARWFERGAEAALDVAAHETARALLQRALVLTAPDAVADEARRRARLGQVTAQNADMDEGAAELLRAIDGYRALLAAGEDVRDGYARAVAALGWVRNQQVRFDLATDLAEEGLAVLGTDDDAPGARLLVLRAVAVNHATDDVERPRDDAERALAVARALGDEELEVEALRAVAQVRGGLADWQALALAAAARRRWGEAADALRTEGAILLELDRDAAAATLDRAEELCRARGLTESLAWTEYSRAELGLLYGDWDDAIAAGRRAIELGVANAYHRVTLRTWSCLLPIAAARGDGALAAEAQAWMDGFQPPAQASLYALILVSARDLHVADCGLGAPFVPGVEERLPAFALGYGLASWYAGLERVLRAWLEAGELGGAAEAVERLRGGLEAEEEHSDVAWSVEALLRARVREAEGDRRAAAESGRRAAQGFGRTGARPWRAKALRLLDRLGAASAAERVEADDIDRALGIRAAS